METRDRDFIDPRLLELLDDLEKYATAGRGLRQDAILGVFKQPLQNLLAERHCSTLIVSGAETDVCVLATVINAVDLGYRVVIASDAICSSSDECHDALMTLYHKRFSQQIEIASTKVISKIGRVVRHIGRVFRDDAGAISGLTLLGRLVL
jgi:hypothetical protein